MMLSSLMSALGFHPILRVSIPGIAMGFDFIPGITVLSLSARGGLGKIKVGKETADRHKGYSARS